MLDCDENSTLVFGHNAKTKEELEDMIRSGRCDELIGEIPISKGDLVQITFGTLVVAGSLTLTQDYPFLIMSVIEGDGQINGQMIAKGDHFIVPNGYGIMMLQGDMQLIVSTV